MAEAGRYFFQETPELRERVEADLAEIEAAVLSFEPRAALVLAGSMACGEGIPPGLFGPDHPGSDLDLFVVVPGPRDGGRFGRVREALVRRSPSVAVNLMWLWRGFLSWRITSAGGRILRADEKTRRILEDQPPPSSVNNYRRALVFSAQALLDPAAEAELLDKALIRLHQGILLERFRNRPMQEWSAAFSLAFAEQALTRNDPPLPPEVSARIGEAIARRRIPERPGGAAGRLDLPSVREAILAVRRRFSDRLTAADALKFLRKRRRPPLFNVTRATLAAGEALLRAARPDGDADQAALSESARILRRLGERIAEGEASLARVARAFTAAAGYAPHRLERGAGLPRIIPGAAPPQPKPE